MKLTFFSIWTLLMMPLFAQAPPASDIWIGTLTLTDSGSTVAELTKINPREGYNNQPHFLPGGDVLYTALTDEGNTDIFRYHRKDRNTSRVSTTPESEYSPTLMPGGVGLSVVRVEQDGTQRLWQLPLTKGKTAPLLPETTKVGYHTWLNERSLALFLVGEPHTLHIATLGKAETQLRAKQIGRCMALMPKGEGLSFVHKESESSWMVKQLDPTSGKIVDLVATLPGCEDYVWSAKGDLFMAKDAKLYRWRKGWDNWREAFDFSSHGIQTIKRLALSGDMRQLALVSMK